MSVGIGALVERIADRVSSGLIVVTRTGAVAWANRTIRQMAGTAGVPAGDDVLADLPFMGKLTAGERSTRHWNRPDGLQRRLELSCRYLQDGPVGDDPLLLYEIVDVTERYRRERQTRRSEDHLFRIERLARAGTWEWDLESDVVVWSDDLLAAFGFPSDKDLDYHEFRSLVHHEDLPQIERTLARALETCQPFTYNHRMYLGDRVTQRIFECYGEIIADESGRPIRVMGAVHDLTDDRRAREELAYLADRDPLTSLPNRRTIVRHLRERLSESCGGGALLLVDIDDFKELNDLHGQAAGDQLLQYIAPFLLQHSDPRAFVGRYDGDQFALVLPEGGAEEALAAAHSVCETTALHTFAATGVNLKVHVSVGVVPLRSGADAETLMAHAQDALQRAKWAGKSRAVLYDPQHQTGNTRRAAMFTRIADALNAGRMELDAQPVVDLATRTVVAYEVLLRLRDGMDPPLGPGHFLPMLERSELVNRLDRWVVAEAVGALRSEHCRARGLGMEVNISTRSLTDPWFGDFVLDTLRAGGVDPSRLTLEVAESAAIAHPDALRRLAETLAAGGAGLALDDFSAGLGSFIHFKDLPIIGVKISGAFFRRADWSDGDELLVKAIATAAGGVGMRTTAKHVEHEPLLRTLAHLGVHRGQSHLLGTACPLTNLLYQP